MKENKIYWTFLSIVILLAVGVGVFTQKSYATQTVILSTYLEQGNQARVSLDEDAHYLSIYFDNNMANLAQLQKSSDLIVRVKATNERVNYLHAILTGVDVEAVYKGDVKEGDHVDLYEPSSFYGSSYFIKGGYNIMQEGQEYIVFLKHLKVPAGYSYRGNEADSFMPVSTFYSKYPLQSKGTTHVVSEDAGDLYNQIKDYDIVTQDANALKKYEQLKLEVLKQMK